MLHKMVNGVATPLTAEELEDYAAREAEHAQVLAEMAQTQYVRDRARAYPPLDELLVALIEKEEGRPEALDALMELRLQVKLQYPKP